MMWKAVFVNQSRCVRHKLAICLAKGAHGFSFFLSELDLCECSIGTFSLRSQVPGVQATQLYF